MLRIGFDGTLMSRMMIYLWEDTDAPEAEVKFGDHWVEGDCDLPAAVENTRRYIRGSLGRQKHKFDEGRVIIHGIWDASVYAQAVGRFKVHAKVDDAMRNVIGHHVQADIHRIDAETAKNRILKELNRIGQPLPKAGLSLAQCLTTEELVKAYGDGSSTVIAELCARFGKTIFAGAVAKELDVDLVVVVSYVLTVFTSFENDWRSFEQFKDYEHVDVRTDANYRKTIDDHLRNGRKVVAYLSMCASGNRQARIDYMFGKRASRLVVIDEADYGVHRKGQSAPLIAARKKGDKVLIMTGTNADRAVSEWKVDYYAGTTYPELVMNKKVPVQHKSKLKHFKHNPNRDELVVDVEFYQMDLIDVVNSASKQWMEDDTLPSWSKFAANPVKAKGFFVRMLEAMFLGKHSLDGVNVDYQANTADQKVAMMFLPGSMRNENLEVAVQIAEQALPGYEVVALSGYNKTTNRTAERKVRDAIERADRTGKSVLILSTNMAQRSFSVPQITDLFLAYDGGDYAATIQKMSRALTPYNKGKVGRVWSLSFDPNRDDKFDSILIETARNYQKTRGISSLKDAMREVLKTIDIFSCTDDGSVAIDIDEYLKAAHDRKSISRVIGKVADITKLDDDEIEALAKGNGEYFKAARQKAAKKGRIRELKKKAGKKGKKKEDLIKKARETIVMIVENIDIIVYGTGCKRLDDAFAMIEKSLEKQLVVEQEFGVPYDLIAHLFESGVINEGFVELLVDC